MTPLLAMLWGCAPADLLAAEAEVSRLEGEIVRLRAELDVLEAHAPSRRPTRPKAGRCLTLEALVDGAALLEGAHRGKGKGKAEGGGFVLGAVPKHSFWGLARAQPGDEVVSVAGVRIEKRPDAARAVEAVRAAGTVPIVVEVERDGEALRLTADPWCR